MIRGKRGLAAAFAVALASAGCAGTARVDSKKSEDYSGRLGRVLVVCRMDKLGADFASAFRTGFVERLAERGAEARFAALESELSVEQGPSLEKQAKAFRATTILVMAPAGGVVNQYGSVIRANFDGQLFDVAASKRVWRAKVEYVPGATALPVEQRAGVLVNELVTALAADGLVEAAPREAQADPAPAPEVEAEAAPVVAPAAAPAPPPSAAPAPAPAPVPRPARTSTPSRTAR